MAAAGLQRDSGHTTGGMAQKTRSARQRQLHPHQHQVRTRLHGYTSCCSGKAPRLAGKTTSVDRRKHRKHSNCIPRRSPFKHNSQIRPLFCVVSRHRVCYRIVSMKLVMSEENWAFTAARHRFICRDCFQRSSRQD